MCRRYFSGDPTHSLHTRVGMALVTFTLSEDGVGAFNDALVCIHKFSDDVSLEVKKDKVRSTLSRVVHTLVVSPAC